MDREMRKTFGVLGGSLVLLTLLNIAFWLALVYGVIRVARWAWGA